MPPMNPRIIVVDDNRGISNIVRASLELLGRRPRLIETQSADDALMELRVSAPDLLVTAHTLPDGGDGMTLAVTAKRELAALPIILLGNESDPVPDEETLAQSPFQYLRTPMAPETFIRVLRIALDGPEAAPQQSDSEEISAPVPMVDTDKLRPILFQLMRDVGAMAAVLADRNGKVISFEGAAGYIDRDLLAATLGPGFGSTSKILSIIGEQPRVLKYFDGDKLDVFALAVGLHFFITLIFDNKAGSTLGNVKRFGGNAVNEMVDVMSAETAFSAQAASAAAPTKSEGKVKKGRRTQEMAAVVAAEAAKHTPSKKAEAPEKTANPKMDPIENFDSSLLDGLDNVDLDSADAMFAPDKMVSSQGGGGNKVSFEDAMMQGIIGDVDE